MTHGKQNAWRNRAFAALALPLAAVWVSGCAPADRPPRELPAGEQFGKKVDAAAEPADNPPNDFTYDVTYPYTPDYREGIPENLDQLTGESVAVSAEISRVVTQRAFILSGSGDSTSDGLLVIHHQSLPGLSAGETVGVRGVVHDSFDPSTIAKERPSGQSGQLFSGSAGEPYINATNIDTGTFGPETGADVEDIVQVEPEGESAEL